MKTWIAYLANEAGIPHTFDFYASNKQEAIDHVDHLIVADPAFEGLHCNLVKRN